MKKIKGVSLLEAMLFLVIAALVLMLTMRYFNQAKEGQQINTAITMIQKVRNITQKYAQTASYSSDNVSIKYYQEQGLLPASYSQNPWRGEVNASMDASNNTLIVTLTNVPSQLCLRMVSQLNPTISDTTVESFGCGAKGKTYKGNKRPSLPSLPGGVTPSKIPDKIPDKISEKAQGKSINFIAVYKIV